tara:strand:+ start:458 stop:820 length:363 start_codon:yes stop_codon:yes gene_type:complete
MSELLAAIVILLADWGTACTHMAYRNRIIDAQGVRLSEYMDPVRMPFYNIPLPIFGDVWHLFGAVRYLAFGMLAYLSFGIDPEDPAWWAPYLATALVDYAGRQVLKRLHRKDWPLHRWLS